MTYQQLSYQKAQEKIYEILYNASKDIEALGFVWGNSQKFKEFMDEQRKELVALECAINPEDEIKGMANYDL